MPSKKETSSPSAAPSSSEQQRRSGAAPHELSVRRGRVRDALAALGNVEAVLRSRRHAPAPDELDELRRALAWLREAFAASAHEAPDGQRAARETLEAFAAERVSLVESALATPSAPDPDRLAAAAVDLDAAAGLLELAERAVEGAAVEVSIATLAEQALQLSWTMRAHGALGVHVIPSETDCSVSCDPQVIARVLAIAVSAVHERAAAVTVRTHVEDGAGVIEVAGRAPDDLGGALMQTRLVRRVAPTDAVVVAAARAAGITVAVEDERVLVRCPRLA